MLKPALALLVVLAAAPAVAQDFGGYRPQIPPAAGYDATGGRGGYLGVIDTLDWDAAIATCTGTCGGLFTTAVCDTVTCKHGGLKPLAEDTVARFILCAVSGFIDVPGEIQIHSNATLAGQSCPSPGIAIRYPDGYAVFLESLYVIGSNVVVQHIATWGGLACTTGLAQYGGGGSISDIIFDHVSVFYAQDGSLGIGAATHDTIIWRSFIGKSLYFPAGSEGCTGGGINEGQGFFFYSAADGAVMESASSSTSGRNPYIQGDVESLFLSNIIYNTGGAAEDSLSTANFDTGGGSTGGPWSITFAGNRYICGPNTTTGALERWTSDNAGTPAGNELYINDVTFDGSCYTGGILNELPYNPVVGTPPVALPSGYTVTGSAGLEAFLLPKIGARPVARDSVTQGYITEITNRTGSFLSDPADGLGYPTLATNTGTLAVPASPHTIAGNGRSNIENWLETLAQAVEDADEIGEGPPAGTAKYRLRLKRKVT